LNAFGGQCGAALRAEAPTLRIIRVTAQAFHEMGPVAYSREALPISGNGFGRSFSLSTSNFRSSQSSPSVATRCYFLTRGQPPS
jgi:hypothetical protein